MILEAHFFKFLIVVVFIKQNFACTYEKRYVEVNANKQNVTKTLTYCCKGYVRYKEDLFKVTCHPVCENCIKGYCPESSKCSCNDGYTGDNCTESCTDGKWGRNCLMTCNCLNGAPCDHKKGHCICVTGWEGKYCEKNITEELINAANSVRMVDAEEHEELLKNISSVQNKFTETVENLHEPISKTSKQVEIILIILSVILIIFTGFLTFKIRSFIIHLLRNSLDKIGISEQNQIYMEARKLSDVPSESAYEPLLITRESYGYVQMDPPKTNIPPNEDKPIVNFIPSSEGTWKNFGIKLPGLGERKSKTQPLQFDGAR